MDHVIVKKGLKILFFKPLLTLHGVRFTIDIVLTIFMIVVHPSSMITQFEMITENVEMIKKKFTSSRNDLLTRQ